MTTEKKETEGKFSIGELYSIKHALTRLGHVKNVFFAYWRNRNIDRINQELKEVEKLLDDQDWKRFEKEVLVPVHLKYCIKNEAGEVLPDRFGNFDYTSENRKKHDIEFNAIKDNDKDEFILDTGEEISYKEMAANREKAFKDYDDLLKKDAEYEPYILKKEHLLKVESQIQGEDLLGTEISGPNKYTWDLMPLIEPLD
jgi:hypothetical protein